MGMIRAALLVMIAGVMSVSQMNAATAELSEYQVKAAYFYNFAKFVEWPKERFSSATDPIKFCVLRDPLFQMELLRIVQGKIIAGHPIEVVHMESAEQSLGCNALFVNSSQERHTRRLMEALRSRNVLTVGETEEFLRQGGIIAFVIENERVQFQINRKAASAAGLYISSKILNLAKRVVD